MFHETILPSRCSSADGVPESPTRRRFASLVAPILAALLLAGVGASAAGASESSYWDEHFLLHGFVTTAYAEGTPSDAPLPFVEEQIFGIPEDGTFDYRIAALQLRYVPTKSHSFCLQLSHRSFGDSVLEPITDAVELDWLFWKWKLSSRTILRFGRFPTSAGIFNELRDLGTLLPFFRPAFTFYREGSLFSETVDGAGISHRFDLADGWQLSADLYVGRFDVIEQSASSLGTGVVEVEAPRALGAQLWLVTPVDTLRFGLGTLHWDVSEKSNFNQTEARWKSWYLSLDGDFEHWVVRAEYRHLMLPIDVPPVFPNGEGIADIYYWQLGWKPGDRFSLYVQSEFTDAEQRHATVVDGSFTFNQRRDEGVVFRWAFRPNLVAKAEYHEVNSELILPTPVVTPEGLLFAVPTENFDSDYSIISLSYSF